MGFKSNLRQYTETLVRQGDRVEEVMAGVILARAMMLAPKETGALKANGRVIKNANGGRSIIFGDGLVPYARIRHFENKKSPNTIGYLQRAGDSVAKEPIKKYQDISI